MADSRTVRLVLLVTICAALPACGLLNLPGGIGGGAGGGSGVGGGNGTGGGSGTGGGTVSSGREICVANSGADGVLVFDATQNGDGPPLRTLLGRNALKTPWNVAVDTVHNEVVVASGGTDSLVVYSRTASGDAAPLRVISGSATALGNPMAVAVDTVNDEIISYGTPQPSGATLLVHSRTANGNAAPLRKINGPTTGLGATYAVAVDPVHNEIWVANYLGGAGSFSSGSIVVYSRTATGDAAPLRTMVVSAPDGGSLSLNGGIDLDPAHNEVFVTSSSAVVVLDRSASGTAIPKRTITVSTVAGDVTTPVAYDPQADQLVVSTYGLLSCGFSIYPRTASGNVAPTQTLSGSCPFRFGLDPVNREAWVVQAVFAQPVAVVAAWSLDPIQRELRVINPTGLSHPWRIAVDPAHDELIVSEPYDHKLQAAVATFPRAGNGERGAVRSIAGPRTGLQFGVGVGFVGLDLTHDELYVTSIDTKNTATGYPPEFVTVYPRSGNGDLAPTRQFTVGSTALNFPGGVVVDEAHDEVYVAAGGALYSFPRTVTGPDAGSSATRVISGAATGLSAALGLVLDAAHDELLVVDTMSNAVLAFPRTANGDVAPARKIAGAATTLSGPSGLALDSAREELFVTNTLANSPTGARDAILVFNRTATGNVAPIRTVAGAATGLNGPGGIVICK